MPRAGRSATTRRYGQECPGPSRCNVGLAAGGRGRDCQRPAWLARGLGAHWRSSYEWLGHSPLALKTGLSAGVIEAIRVGAPSPAFKHADEAAVHAFASELWRTGQVGDATFSVTAALFREQGAVDPLGILGYYGIISMTVDAFRIEGAEGVPDPSAA